MLRLGRKYDIVYLENEALQRLHHDYPTTLKEWDSLREDTNRQIDPASDVHEIISIAHEFGLNTILPAAYVQYLESRTLVALFYRKMLCFLIVSSSRRLYWMILVYLWKRANIALSAMPELWNLSRAQLLMHFVLHWSFRRKAALAMASARPNDGKQSKICRCGELRNP
jgi:hypothetical protein